MTEAERDDSCRIKIGEHQSAKEGEPMSNGNSQSLNTLGEMNGCRDSNAVEIPGHEVVPASMNLKEMAKRVGMKMAKLPLTYATILGLIYSIIAGRYCINWALICTHSVG